MKKLKKIIKAKLIVVSSLLVLISGLISLYHITYQNKVYPHVLVANIEISNLSIAKAEARLNQLTPRDIPTVKLTWENQVFPLKTESLEIIYDRRRTVEKAFLIGRSNGWLKDLQTKWKIWWKPVELEIEYQLNEKELEKNLEEIAGQIDMPAIESGLVINTKQQVELIKGVNGRTVKKEQLKQIILGSIGNLSFDPIKIPVRIDEVETNENQLKKAKKRAEQLKGKKLVIDFNKDKETIQGQELIDLVGFEKNWNEIKVASLSMRLANKIDRQPQDAVFKFDGSRAVEFKPALEGLRLDQGKTRQNLIKGLTELEQSSATETIITLEAKKQEPKIKTDQVNDLGIKELLGKGESTFHGSIPSRKHNVALTAAKLNGILLAPGEIFSFNQRLGDISRATGYQTAYIIKEGRTVLGDGGGVCQDSTTMFRAVLNAGLEIIERHPHAYRVGYYEQNSPVGVDATVYSPSPDFKFKNDTPAYVLIQTKVNTQTNYMKVEIYGTNDGRQSNLSNFRLWEQTPPPDDLYVDDPTLPVGVVKQIDWKAWGGKAAFDWKVVKGNQVLHEKTFYSNYQPWQSVFLRGTGS